MSNVPEINELPPAPLVTDTESAFANKASAFVAALPDFRNEANALGAFVEGEAEDAEAARTGAEAAQTAAELARDAALAAPSLVNYQGVWEAGIYNTGESVFHTPTGLYYISDIDGNDDEPPSANWSEVGTAESIAYDNTESGLIATNVQAAIDEVAALSPSGYFAKTDSNRVAWLKTDNDTAETSQKIFVEVGGSVLEIPEGANISMPTLVVGTDYAIWVEPDGALTADASFTSPPVAGARRVGGFHYAPGGNATISATGDWTTHSGGDTTPQINECSFYDLKWKPSAPDPRGLTLVNDSFWTGMYLMSNGDGAGPLHRYNVDPCRDGNAPFKPYATTPTRYINAIPVNISETLMYNGFRMPNIDEFQLLALGVNEQRSIGGSGPGNTGIVADRGKNQQTSAWGVFDATGVLNVWGRGGSADQTSDTVSGVSQGRTNDLFRISRFARFGGRWDLGSDSGSRYVIAGTASNSATSAGGRGVCDHLILD